MRHKYNSKFGLERQANARLANAFLFRPITSIVIFEIRTRNPRTGTEHLLEIRHETPNGNNRYYAYLDGVKWRKPFSRLGFCRWLWGKIDPVVFDLQ